MNLVELLDNMAAQNGQNLAVIFRKHQVNYEKLKAAVDKLAQGLLELGLESGDRVALMLPNIPQFVISYYAILKIGAVVVSVNVMFKEDEIKYLLEDSEAKAVISWGGFKRSVLKAAEEVVVPSNLIFLGDKVPAGTQNLTRLMAESPPLKTTREVAEDDTAVILYTAGTTGRPKGAELTHSNMLSNALACKDTLRLTTTDRLLAVLPLYHSYGQTVVMNTAIAAGAIIVLLPKFDPKEALRSIQEEEITIFAGVPTMFAYLLQEKDEHFNLSSLRYCLSSGSKLPIELMEDFEASFGVKIYEGYGLSETSFVASFNPLDLTRKPGSVGLPISGVEMTVFNDKDEELKPGEIGEIVIRGSNLMKGYLNRPEATKEALRGGWFHTGDLGKMDEDGYFYIADRKKDVIIKGGFNIYPKEVEDLLRHHPQVEEVAVIGIPDPLQGEEVKACIVLKPGQKVAPEEIIRYCQEKLAVYKCPKVVEFYDSLPKGPSGKILRRELRSHENSKSLNS